MVFGWFFPLVFSIVPMVFSHGFSDAFPSRIQVETAELQKLCDELNSVAQDLEVTLGWRKAWENHGFRLETWGKRMVKQGS